MVTACIYEIGGFEDLKTLIDLLNQAFSDVQYRLEPVADQKNTYLFIEDPLSKDEYECGIIVKRGLKAYAPSMDVHGLILGAYMRLKEMQGK